eukprot:3877786-Amphidinium_carterae.1
MSLVALEKLPCLGSLGYERAVPLDTQESSECGNEVPTVGEVNLASITDIALLAAFNTALGAIGGRRLTTVESVEVHH